MIKRNKLLFLALCLLLTIACLPAAIPNTPTTTLSPTSSPAPAPTHSAPPPTSTLPLDHAPVLRAEFAADLALFPDATRYEIELIVDLDATTVTGHERISYTNTADIALDALYLRLFPNTPGYGSEMAVTDVLLNGAPVEPVAELDRSALRLPLDPPLETGVQLDLTLDFTVAIPTQVGAGYRQFGYYDGILALTNVYPLIPVYDEEGWNVEIAPTYGDAVYSETSFYTV
ncbi:MAG: hypothetical protein U9R15_01180, partial [Chloroflexota bacterium]|nr:hypothetical protein [Chloroflexota bacterium]